MSERRKAKREIKKNIPGFEQVTSWVMAREKWARYYRECAEAGRFRRGRHWFNLIQ